VGKRPEGTGGNEEMGGGREGVKEWNRKGKQGGRREERERARGREREGEGKSGSEGE